MTFVVLSYPFSTSLVEGNFIATEIRLLTVFVVEFGHSFCSVNDPIIIHTPGICMR
jgi:hypothetical protein